jgi:hypothetical protein
MKRWHRGLLCGVLLVPIGYSLLQKGSAAAAVHENAEGVASAERDLEAPARPPTLTQRVTRPTPSEVLKVTPKTPAPVPSGAPSPAEPESANTQLIPGDPLIPRVFPASIAEVPMTPWRKARLDELAPVDRKLLDFKLGVLSRMRECDDELLNAKGKMQVFLHFAVDALGTAQPSSAELVNSTLPQGLDEEALECLRDAHMGSALALVGDEAKAGGPFHFGTEITLPLDKDPAYQFFAH